MFDFVYILAIIVLLIQFLLITIFLRYYIKLKHKINIKTNHDSEAKSCFRAQRHPFHLNKQKVLERYFPREVEKAVESPPKLITSKRQFTLFENYKKILISGKKYAD